MRGRLRARAFCDLFDGSAVKSSIYPLQNATFIVPPLPKRSNNQLIILNNFLLLIAADI